METRTRICADPECGATFSYAVGRGTDRRYCADRCRVRSQIRARTARHAQLPRCSVADCSSHATRIGAGLCDTCYCRQRRTGSTERRKRKYRYQRTDGYILLLKPEHVLANADGYVAEHRTVLYEDIGDGPHPCFWCGVSLQWPEIVVDHLNEQKDDNERGNLVVSCNACNRARGTMLPFIDGLSDVSLEVFVRLLRERNQASQVKRVAC